ncbi:glycosyltransferase family 4 protein [Actinopolymorpha alba]|uniref:glycosyltransferase family 4 protein n=1 Tax=Actinopolymorpha alba TaxID=533267 RepID=UPI000399A09A|nr:glycosyltransferase family 4 protein [Actinopolymorpha alba]
MKVVHVSDCFLPRLGGIEIQVAELARLQSEAGHEVHVVTATPDRDGSARIPQGISVHRVVAALPFELPIHPRTGHHVGRICQELQPDVLHLHVGAVSPFAWSALRVAARRSLPTVVTVHSMWDPITRGLYEGLDAGLRWSGWPVVCTTVSEAAAAPIRSVVGSRIPVHVVANGIDTAQWRPEPLVSGSEVREERPEDLPAEVHVVAVGRLAPRKRPLTLLRILRATRAALGAGVRLRATVVGDGPARGLMERYLRHHAMSDWVELAGRLDRAEVRAVLRSADVFLAPANRESFGIAALEARTAGVPVVAYAEGGVADFVISEKEGLLGRSPAELAAAVVRLARDHDLRTAIAEHNRATEPVRCTWPVVLSDFEERYSQARARAGNGGGRGGGQAGLPGGRRHVRRSRRSTPV